MLVFIIRIFFFLAMASTGYAFGQALGGGNELWGMIGFMAAALAVIFLDVLFRRKDISVVSAVLFGLIVGLVVAALLSPVVDMYTSIPAKVRDVVKIAVATLTAYLAVSLILQTKDDFRFVIPYIEFAKQQKGGRPLLLDTSVVIDGRIADIAATRFIDAPLVVPRFVLR
ncbi:MAG: PIN/TRAM domain-containing protein, partial [Planctomycetes bacterium]|nr:PIN/TRAM domain-containing protein [Planctomycetota bacterium]